MKVHLVWQMNAMLPFPDYQLLKVFESKEKAESHQAKLRLENDNPLVEDDYGPVGGCDFLITEATVE